MRGSKMRLGLCFWAALTAASLRTEGASVTLQGTIATDDTVQLFDIVISSPSSADFRSYGYAGGTTSTSQVFRVVVLIRS